MCRILFSPMEETNKKGCQCDIEALGKNEFNACLPHRAGNGSAVLTSGGGLLFQFLLVEDLLSLQQIMKGLIRDSHTNKSLLSHNF